MNSLSRPLSVILSGLLILESGPIVRAESNSVPRPVSTESSSPSLQGNDIEARNISDAYFENSKLWTKIKDSSPVKISSYQKAKGPVGQDLENKCRQIAGSACDGKVDPPDLEQSKSKKNEYSSSSRWDQDRYPSSNNSSARPSNETDKNRPGALEVLGLTVLMTLGSLIGIPLALAAGLIAGFIQDLGFGLPSTQIMNGLDFTDKDSLGTIVFKLWGNSFNAARWAGRVVTLLGGPVVLGVGIAASAGALALPMAATATMIAAGGVLTARGIFQGGRWAYEKISERSEITRQEELNEKRKANVKLWKREEEETRKLAQLGISDTSLVDPILPPPAPQNSDTSAILSYEQRKQAWLEKRIGLLSQARENIEVLQQAAQEDRRWPISSSPINRYEQLESQKRQAAQLLKNAGQPQIFGDAEPGEKTAMRMDPQIGKTWGLIKVQNDGSIHSSQLVPYKTIEEEMETLLVNPFIVHARGPVTSVPVELRNYDNDVKLGCTRKKPCFRLHDANDQRILADNGKGLELRRLAVRSIAQGTVLLTGMEGSAGNRILLYVGQAGDGGLLFERVIHLGKNGKDGKPIEGSGIFVQPGDTLESGEIIGLAGNTGAADTSWHSHGELYAVPRDDANWGNIKLAAETLTRLNRQHLQTRGEPPESSKNDQKAWKDAIDDIRLLSERVTIGRVTASGVNAKTRRPQKDTRDVVALRYGHFYQSRIRPKLSKEEIRRKEK